MGKLWVKYACHRFEKKLAETDGLWTVCHPSLFVPRGTAAAAPPPFRPGNPALCGSCPLVTPYYCRLGDLLCYTCMLYLSTILCVYACVFCVFFVFGVFPLQLPPSVLWYCRLGLLTCKNRLPYNLYCVGGDVKHCSIQSNPILVCSTLGMFVLASLYAVYSMQWWLSFCFVIHHSRARTMPYVVAKQETAVQQRNSYGQLDFLISLMTLIILSAPLESVSLMMRFCASFCKPHLLHKTRTCFNVLF